MQFIRVVGQGRISELLANTPETVEFDKTFRKLRMYKDAVEALKTADKDVLETLGAYTAGITAYENEGNAYKRKIFCSERPSFWISVCVARLTLPYRSINTKFC